MEKKRMVFTGDSITDCDRLWDEGREKLGFGYVRMIREQLSQRRRGDRSDKPGSQRIYGISDAAAVG